MLVDNQALRALLLLLLLPGCGSSSSGRPDASVQTTSPDGSAQSDGSAHVDARDMTAAIAPMCHGRWCWEMPKPHGHTFRAVLAERHDRIWAAGDAGWFARFDGGGWTLTKAETDATVHALAKVGEDIWAVGSGGAFLKVSGDRVLVQPQIGEGDLASIWARNEHDVWVTGSQGVWHFDGSAWRNHPELRATQIWGAGDRATWAIDGSIIWQWSDGAWAKAYDHGEGEFTVLRGTSPTDLWAIGTDGGSHIVVRSKGSQWQADPDAAKSLTATVSSFTQITAAWDANGKLWLAANGGSSRRAIAQWDGSGWRKMPVEEDARRHFAVHGVGDFIVAVGEYGRATAGKDGVWQPVGSATLQASLPFKAIAGAATAGEVWVVASTKRILRFDGTAFTAAMGADNNTSLELNGVAVCGSDVWAVGNGGQTLRLRPGDRNFEAVMNDVPTTGALARSLDAVACQTAEDVWAVGEAGTVAHWNGQRWTSESVSGGYHWLSVAVASDGAVWMRGSNGSVAVRDGGRWQVTKEPIEGDRTGFVITRGIWASRRDDVWAGRGEDLLHLVDGTWQPVSLPRTSSGPIGSVSAIWGTRADDVWATTTAGRVFHFDGRAWAREDTQTDVPLSGVAGSGDGSVWLVGPGAVLRRR